jgi:hypothetical protein
MTLEEKLNTKVYSLEIGYLLPKEDKEYEAYSKVYDKQNAYYDELQCYIVGNLHEILNKLEQQFKTQHLANEYMILKFECLVQNFASLELEDIEKMTLDQIETFLNEECFDTDNISYDLESIVWSVYKDENGIIHEDFIRK